MILSEVTTVRARMAYTVGANLAKTLLNFATGMLLARGLGPHEYGSLAFLLGIALSIRQLLDMGSSTAFFTFISQRPRTARFVSYYVYWFVAQVSVPILVVGLLFPDRWLEVVWQGEQRGLVVLSFAAAFLQYGLWPSILQIGESQRATRWVQLIAVGIAFLHLVVVGVLWLFAHLSLYLVFGAIAIEYLAAAWLAGTKFKFATEAEEGDTRTNVILEFARFCIPLVVFAWLGFAFDFADRWLLQTYGGSVQQAYYAVAAQVAGVAAIAASSVQNVLWKEIAEAHHRGDTERVARLYRKVSRILYMGAAALSGLLMPWSSEILLILLGPAYVGGASVLAIMLLYPILLAKQHVESTVLLATGRVKVYTAINAVFMGASIVVAYFVLASPQAAIPGLGLASIGLAAKMVVMALIQANLNGIFVARGLGLRVDWQHQLTALAIALPVGWVCHYLIRTTWETSLHPLPSIAIAAVAYALVLLIALHAMPWLVDATRLSLTAWYRRGA